MEGAHAHVHHTAHDAVADVGAAPIIADFIMYTPSSSSDDFSDTSSSSATYDLQWKLLKIVAVIVVIIIITAPYTCIM